MTNPRVEVPLRRRLVGQALRRHRQAQGRTLRDVADAARVSMPYLSEVERGRKEASSEVLAAICRALGIRLADLLDEVRLELARVEPLVVPSAAAGANPARTAALTGPGFTSSGGPQLTGSAAVVEVLTGAVAGQATAGFLGQLRSRAAEPLVGGSVQDVGRNGTFVSLGVPGQGVVGQGVVGQVGIGPIGGMSGAAGDIGLSTDGVGSIRRLDATGVGRTGAARIVVAAGGGGIVRSRAGMRRRAGYGRPRCRQSVAARSRPTAAHV
uniref:helix-turn-helix domain-containing protein n=1 Tax=Candidatus Frankia nodulisporulans TaxID=2060052 RepID=UPI001C2E42B7|nr:helix-turn-helix transcriptional regulator [Candidatus Frankia nodulisporulans]